MIKYSIILPTFNRGNLTAGVAFNFLHLLKHRDDFEIIVVNDGSTDNTLKIISSLVQLSDKVRLITSNKKSGEYRNPGYARNIGIQAAQGEIVCFCDGDIFHLIEPLSSMDQIIQKYGKDGFYATGTYMRTTTNGECSGPHGYGKNMPHGSWLATSKNNLMKIGGYDERFKIYGNEDHDIVQRLERLGLKHISESKIIGSHPAFDVEREQEKEPDSVKKRQMEYQRESSVIRNAGKKWGGGGKEFIAGNKAETLQPSPETTLGAQPPDYEDIQNKLNNIQMLVEMMGEDSTKISKILNLSVNLNSVLVAHQQSIFQGKKHIPFLGGMREVFAFTKNLDGLVCSDFEEVKGAYKDVFKLTQPVDCIVLSQLHRQRNVGLYLDAAFNSLKLGGELVVICPIFSNCIGSGNTNNLWNAGSILYNLILSGFDCKQAKVSTFSNQIQIYVQKNDREIPSNHSLATLYDFFPIEAHQHFNGNILEANWK